MGTHLILVGARVATGPSESVRRDLLLPGRGSATSVDLSGYLLLPGLTNAHDHLEFALFPRLGQGPYQNAREWSADIYRPNESPIREQRAVPRNIRLIRGALRNLACGVTTVSHHNPWEPVFDHPDFPVRVVKRYGWAHSLAFADDVEERYGATLARQPFIIHAGEGTDDAARAEIPQLDSMGVLCRNTVLVHAVAADNATWSAMARRRASVVWCPSSNRFLFGRTIAERHLRGPVPVALGTDSPLTADGDMIDEIRAARQWGGLTAEEVYGMVTTTATRVLRIRQSPGDWIAVKGSGQSPAEALLRIKPEMVLVGGKIRLLSGELGRKYGNADFESVDVKGRGTVLIFGLTPGGRGLANK